MGRISFAPKGAQNARKHRFGASRGPLGPPWGTKMWSKSQKIDFPMRHQITTKNLGKVESCPGAIVLRHQRPPCVLASQGPSRTLLKLTLCKQYADDVQNTRGPILGASGSASASDNMQAIWQYGGNVRGLVGCERCMLQQYAFLVTNTGRSRR